MTDMDNVCRFSVLICYFENMILLFMETSGQGFPSFLKVTVNLLVLKQKWKGWLKISHPVKVHIRHFNGKLYICDVLVCGLCVQFYSSQVTASHELAFLCELVSRLHANALIIWQLKRALCPERLHNKLAYMLLQVNVTQFMSCFVAARSLSCLDELTLRLKEHYGVKTTKVVLFFY